jgi:hypothetical protein
VPASDAFLRKELLAEAEKVLDLNVNLETINGNDVQARITARGLYYIESLRKADQYKTEKGPLKDDIRRAPYPTGPAGQATFTLLNRTW